MKTLYYFAATFVVAFIFCATNLNAQPGPQPEFIRKAQPLLREGKFDEALVIYKSELDKDPKLIAALNASGVALDLKGNGIEARKFFARAIEAAPDATTKANAQRQMAMSYGFEGDCKNTVKYEQMVFDYWGTKKDFYQQGEMYNEAARVCIDSGDLKTAEKYYLLGQKFGLQEPDIKPDRVALWNFRTEHALGRLAARRNQPKEANKHVAAAKDILDKNPEMAKAQAIFYPYLTGYVAFYAKDYKTALSELLKANQNDAFIQCLIGQTYEKLGQPEKAKEMYLKASQVTAHNPPAAFAKPFTRKKLAQK